MDVVRTDVLKSGKALQATIKSAIGKTKTEIKKGTAPIEFYQGRLATLLAWQSLINGMHTTKAAGGGCMLQSLDEWQSS